MPARDAARARTLRAHVSSDTIRPVICRRMVVGLVLLLAGGTLGACGGGGHSSAATRAHTATSSGAARAAGRSLTKAQAVALARAVNLRASDVPGFKASSEEKAHESAAEKRLEQEMLKCVGASSLSGLGASLGGKALAEARSKDFKLQRGIVNLSVHSEVSVARSARVAGKDLSALRGSRVKACLSRYLNLFFKTSLPRGTSIGPVSIQSGTPPAPGAAGSFGWRIGATFTVGRIPVPFYFDILSFAYGPAEVTLFSSGLPEPFPAKAQEHLFSLLVARASEHKA
jgi:hypothetical protein